MGRRKNARGQAAVEYLLAISVIVVAVAAAFYSILQDRNGNQRLGKAFENARNVVEAPYP